MGAMLPHRLKASQIEITPKKNPTSCRFLFEFRPKAAELPSCDPPEDQPGSEPSHSRQTAVSVASDSRQRDPAETWTALKHLEVSGVTEGAGHAMTSQRRLR